MTARPHIVVVGAGFGGLEVSTRLSDALGDDVQITLIDKDDAFMFGFSKLDVMFGRRTWSDVRLPYADISRTNLCFRQEKVTAIDPERRRVTTSSGTYSADVLVVALGADLAPERTPGLVEAGHEFYSPRGAAAVRERLDDFDGGSVVIAVLGGFFKCPPAPYEMAFMLHDHLVRRGLRERTAMHLVTRCRSRSPSPTRCHTRSSACSTSAGSATCTRPGRRIWIRGRATST